jgi:uncharacterized protein (DUF1015 family)
MTRNPQTFIRPIPRAWAGTSEVVSPNYDEFSTDAEAEDYIKNRPLSILGVEMPHCRPDAVCSGWNFFESLPLAKEQIDRLKSTGQLRLFEQVIAIYEIERENQTSLGITVAIDCQAIVSDHKGQRLPGRVIRNEEVFPAKVRQRRQVLEKTGHLTSFPNLVPDCLTDQLSRRIKQVLGELVAPDLVADDWHGHQHRLTIVKNPEQINYLLGAIEDQELYVADGNHRTLAAQLAGAPYFLAVIFCPQTVEILPYNRLISAGVNIDCLDRFLTQVIDRPVDEIICLYYQGSWRQLIRPDQNSSNHSWVEEALVVRALGLDPDDKKKIIYVGGTTDHETLQAYVEAGEASMAIIIPRVSVAEFMTVNRTRSKMPRKSTWFVPKTMAGMLVGEITK